MKTIVFVLLAFTIAFAARNQASMQATGPADALLDHLAAIQTDIRNEQIEHDKLYNTQHQECEDEFEARETAIAEGEDALARSNSHYARCDEALLQAVADLAQVEAYITEINANLSALEAKRTQQAADFETYVYDELDPAIEAVRGAYPIIDSYSTGDAAFVQVTSHMGKSFRTLVKAGKGAAMAAPLAALAELGQDFDQDQINQVRSLFEKLEADLVEARQNAVNLENSRIEIYNSTVEQYNTILDNLDATNAALLAYKSEMENCVAQESNIIEQATSKVANNKAALGAAIEMCGAFETEYENASNGRKNELELLERLTGFIKEQVELFGDYGPESSDVFDAYRQSYEDSLTEQVEAFIQKRNSKYSEHLDRMKLALSH